MSSTSLPAPWVSIQPFKTLYASFMALQAAAQLSLLSIYYVPRRLRPVSTWSWKTSLTIRAVRLLFRYQTATREQRPPQLEPGESKDRFVLVEPTEASSYEGVAAPTNGIEPTRLGGVWFPGDEKAGSLPLPKRGAKMVLHFPGGAFVSVLNPEDIGPPLAAAMSRGFGASHTFLAQYRVARDPSSRFPAALQDAVSFYAHVLAAGHDPRDVYVSGDSAGGNIALALLRYLLSSSSGASKLPLPAGVMAFSPWVYVTRDAARTFDEGPNADKDVLGRETLQWGADMYIPPSDDGDDGDMAQAWPYISPLHHPFASSVPVFVQSGTAEAFIDDDRGFAEEMGRVQGNRVRFHASEGAMHDLALSAGPLGMMELLDAAIEDAREFFDES